MVEKAKALKLKITGDKTASLCNSDVAASKSKLSDHVGGTVFG